MKTAINLLKKCLKELNAAADKSGRSNSSARTLAAQVNLQIGFMELDLTKIMNSRGRVASGRGTVHVVKNDLQTTCNLFFKNTPVWETTDKPVTCKKCIGMFDV